MPYEKKELVELLSVANVKLEQYYKAEKDFSLVFDQILERLEKEYDERLKLKEKLTQMKSTLSISESSRQDSLKKLLEFERALEISLDRMRTIRQQVEESKKLLSVGAESSHELNNRLDEIANQANVTIFPAHKLLKPSH